MFYLVAKENASVWQGFSYDVNFLEFEQKPTLHRSTESKVNDVMFYYPFPKETAMIFSTPLWFQKQRYINRGWMGGPLFSIRYSIK